MRSLIVLIACMTFFIPSTLAFYNITYTCPDECVHNRTVAWNVTIGNQGDSDLVVLQVKFLDAVRRIVLAESDKLELTSNDPNASGSNRTLALSIAKGQQVSLGLQGILPLRNSPAGLNYLLCLTTRRPLEYWALKGPESEYCYPANYTIEMFGCTRNEDCPIEQQCSEHECQELGCSPCQYAENHVCIDYACCSDTDCGGDETCVEHACTPISCSGNATFIVNHGCAEIPCNQGEILSDFQCVEALCSYNEYISNFTCQTLDCAFNEGYLNHSCVPLHCDPGEGIVNHICTPLDCADHEALLNFTCQSLDCGFLRKAEHHSCLVHTERAIQIALLAIATVLGVFVLRRYRRIKKKALVDSLLQRAKRRKKQ